jgi:hypothetical protein
MAAYLYPTPLEVPTALHHLVQATEVVYTTLCLALRDDFRHYTEHNAAADRAVQAEWCADEESRVARVYDVNEKYSRKADWRGLSRPPSDLQMKELLVIGEAAPRPAAAVHVPFLVTMLQKHPDIIARLNCQLISVRAWQAPEFTAVEFFIIYARPISDVNKAILQGVRDGFIATYAVLCAVVRTGLCSETRRPPIPKFEVFMTMYNFMLAAREEAEARFTELPDQ